MSGIKELRDSLAKKMSAMKEKQGKSELNNPSMAEGVNEKAYGIRKNVVYGIVLFLVCAFLSFSYFGMGSDENKEKSRSRRSRLLMSIIWSIATGSCSK